MSVYGNLYTTDGIPVTVGIVVNNTQKGTLISKVRTIHARSDFATQITDKSVLFLKNNKKEINAWFQSLGINVPLGGTQLGVIRSIDLNDIVTQANADVNTADKNVLSFSVSPETDSEYMSAVERGDMETAQFGKHTKCCQYRKW